MKRLGDEGKGSSDLGAVMRGVSTQLCNMYLYMYDVYLYLYPYLCLCGMYLAISGSDSMSCAGVGAGGFRGTGRNWRILQATTVNKQ